MGYIVTAERMDNRLGELRERYRIFAPRITDGRDKKTVRYGEISSISEMVLDSISDFSPKEIFYPIIQTMFNIKEDGYQESALEDDRYTIIFLRACDINAIRRLDTIFLENGACPDEFYRRRRDKLKVFLIECKTSWDNCFCVSMGANIADGYSVAFRFNEDGIMMDVKDAEFDRYFAVEPEIDFTPEYIMENTRRVILPDITSGMLDWVYSLDMWRSYNDKCLSCGGCNAVCGTCSCFDTIDIIYGETSRAGERRRIWGSCMQESYAVMAGGQNVRNNPGDRLRFKTLHKVYDFKLRFGKENMCVGCGRCADRCPADISFADIINCLSAELEKPGGVK